MNGQGTTNQGAGIQEQKPDEAPVVDSSKAEVKTPPTGSDPAPVVSPPPSTQPPAPAVPLSPLPPEGNGGDRTEGGGDSSKAFAELSARLTRLEAESKASAEKAELFRAAAEAGVKDPDYVEFLAGKARGEKGDGFAVGAWLNDLKKTKPELFRVAGAGGGSSSPASVPAAGAGAGDDLEGRLAEARKAGRTMEVLRLETELARKRVGG